MSTHQYIWISAQYHPERRGQLCTLGAIKRGQGRAGQSLAQFADGVQITCQRKHIRVATAASIAQYAPTVDGTRTCRKCLERKPLGEFRERKQGIGREHLCRVCRTLAASQADLLRASEDAGIQIPDEGMYGSDEVI